MKTTLEIVFFNSFCTTALLGSLSWVISKRLKSLEFKHLAEFWFSLAVMMVISYATSSQNHYIMALGLLGWIWPVKTIFQITQDMAGTNFYTRPKVIVMVLGGFLTSALVSYGYPFEIYTAPFCLSIGVVGVMLLKDVYGGKANHHYSILGHTTFALLGLFFLLRLSFPLWLTSNFLLYGSVAHLLVLIGLGASTLANYMEVMKERHETQLKAILKERNETLLGQSKYSELGMMSAGIAHEINNPLAIIQAKATQLLRVHRNPEKLQEVSDGLEQILFTSERINRTIQGVREFVHQDERLATEEFTLKSLIKDVLAFCGQRMKNHGVNLRFYGLENYPLKGNKIQLEQVLLNLLNNSFDAIEFLPDKWIELSVHETEHTIQMYFKDSGNGIAPEISSRIMEPFYTTKKIGKGTGLGLALARGIVEKHGGSLVYVGNATHTTFMMELPKLEIGPNILPFRPSIEPRHNPFH